MNEALHLLKEIEIDFTNHVITHLSLKNENSIQLFERKKNERKH